MEHAFNFKHVPGLVRLNGQLKKSKLCMSLSAFLDQDLYDKSC